MQSLKELLGLSSVCRKWPPAFATAHATQDLADIEAVLRGQGAALDRAWIERQVIERFGERDPRVARLRELGSAITP